MKVSVRIMFYYTVYFVVLYLMVHCVELSESQHGKPNHINGINGAYFKTNKRWNLARKIKTIQGKASMLGMDIFGPRQRRSEDVSDTKTVVIMRRLMSTDDQHYVSDAVTIVSRATTMSTGNETREQTDTISDISQTDIIPKLIDNSYDSEEKVTCQQNIAHTTEPSNATLVQGNTISYRNQSRPTKAGMLSQGLVSAVTYQAINSAVLKASLPLQITVIILCFFSIVVYSMKTMNCPTSVYLISINLTEMLYAVVSLIAYITGNIYGEKAMVSYIYLNVGLYLNNYVGIALKRSTFCVTSFVSAERMLVVGFPLKSKHFRLIRNPALIVNLTIFSSFVFHLFSALKYAIVPYQAPITNETLWKLEFTNLKDAIEKWSLSSKVIFVYMPLAATLLLNVGIVISIRRHRKARRQLNVNDEEKSDAREKQMTVAILVSTFVFVFLALPTVTNSLVSNLATGYGPYTKEHYLFFSIMRLGGFCEFLSSTTNFLFYMTLSSKFRQSFLTLVPCIQRMVMKRQDIPLTNTSMTQVSSITDNSRRSISSNF